MTDFTWLVAVLILAAMLDLGLMVLLRRLFSHSRPAARPEKAVTLFGHYSPVLTWVKYRQLPVPTPLPPTTDADDANLPPDRGELEGGLKPTPKPPWHQAKWVEWLIIFLAVTLFCAGFLDLGADTRLPGNETEIFQVLDWTLVNSLREYGTFPLWNPYIQTGLPFIADPMLHVYNPVITLPVLLYGVQTGFKLGIYFSFLIGAWGMWKLADSLGLGRPARLWTALMFVFAGQPAARFFQGQYQFVLGFAYLPWIIASLLQVAQAPATGGREKLCPFSREVKKPAITAVISLALLSFSGNAYQLYMLLAIALLMLVWLLSFKRRPFVKLNLSLLKNYLLIGALALGLIAIQLLPTAELWPRLNNDTSLAGSQTPGQIFLDFTSKDSTRPDAFSSLPAPHEFYAYLGLTPFLALSLLPLALWKRARRPQLFFILLVILTVVWINMDKMPWREAFLETGFFSQSHHLLRILIFGSLGLIMLAGFGLDTLWGSFTGILRSVQNGDTPSPRSRRMLRSSTFAGMGILVIFMLLGLLDVFNTNQSILRTQQIFQQAFTVQGWVARYDTSSYYVRHLANNAWYEATIANGLRYIDAWYPLSDIRVLEGKVNQRWVQALPNYQTQSPAEPAPENGELIQVVEGIHIYRLPESLPIAFLVNRDVLAQESGRWLQASEVTPLAPFFISTSKVELIAEARGDQLLVLLTTNYPGWQVAIDQTSHPLLNVGGYLAVAIPPGVHKVTFAYRPASFYIGLVITLASSLLVGFLLLKEVRQLCRQLRQRWQSWRSALRQGSSRLHNWWQEQQPQRRLAVYQGGALHLENPIELVEQAQVRVTIERHSGDRSPLGEALLRWLGATGGIILELARAIRLPTALFIVGLVVYLLTRLSGLEDWPIYFFTDEAVQTVMAEDFLHSGLRNYQGELLPTYFSVDATYNLSSLSVYLQVIPYLLFGKSVFITRAVSVMAATFGAAMVGLTLRDIFKLRYWWSAVLLLSIIPAWFLHSRTAFETVEMTAFYAAFLYFYLRYRTINPRALYAALIFGALVFYTYNPGQLIIVVSGIFLLLSDLRYHWQQRRVALRGLLLLVFLVLPYLRYYLAHPESPLQHLTMRAPFWLEDVPLSDKLLRFLSEYLAALDPRYWFVPNLRDLDRHLMQGYGHFFWWMLPLLALGLLINLSRIRSSPHRAVLLALLAGPSGSALVGVGVTRLLVLVIPAAILMTIGLSHAMEWSVRQAGWLVKRLSKGTSPPEQSLTRAHTVLALVGVVLLSWVNLAMLRDARVNGPLWYQDYTLGGMQYGARQLFSAVTHYYQANPGVKMIVSPSWTNGADAVAKFFLPEGAPVQLGSVEGHIFRRLPLDDNTVFVVIPNELEKVQASGKFEQVRVEQIVEYPNGDPGFYFIRLRYVTEIDAILEAERESRRALLEARMQIDGQETLVRYSMLDMGVIELIFDHDKNTVARTLEANPFVIELVFPEARPVSGVTLGLGAAYLQVRVSLTTPSAAEPVVFETTFRGSVAEPELSLDFGRAITASQVRFEFLAPGIPEPTNIHVWDIILHK